VRLKFSQPALFAVAQSADPVAGLIAPVQSTLGLASDTVPEAGLALYEVGTTRTARALAARQSMAMSANLDLTLTELNEEFRKLRYMEVLLAG